MRMWRSGLLLSMAVIPLGAGSSRIQGQESSDAEAVAVFRAGAAVVSITPDPLLPVSGGMGAPSPASKRLGDLNARAAVFARGDKKVAIVSLDLLGFPAVLGDRVRKLVPQIAPENILIAATHTHSAPDVYAFPDGQGGHTADLEYIAWVCSQAAKAVRQAESELQPAKLRTATGNAEGKIAYNYYAPDLYDRRMSVVQALSTRDSQAIVTMVNYAIHPEVLGAAQGVLSPDLVGPLCQELESDVGGTALFLNGAQGGMVTADNRDLRQPPSDPLRGYWKDKRTWAECQRIGGLMADQAMQLLKSAEAEANPQLECRYRDVVFPVDSAELWQVIQYSPLKYPHLEGRRISSRVNLVVLGNARLLTVPGEALPNIGFYLKRKMGGEHNLLLGLTNDAFGYILTRVDFASFPRYDYVSRVSLGEMTGEIYIEQALGLIEEVAVQQTDEASLRLK